MREIKTGDRVVGEGELCLIIAETGLNHNGGINLARRLINIAKEAGADAAKLKTFKAEELVTTHAGKAQYQKETTGAEESQFGMIKKVKLSERDVDI